MNIWAIPISVQTGNFLNIYMSKTIKKYRVIFVQFTGKKRCANMYFRVGMVNSNIKVSIAVHDTIRILNVPINQTFLF